MEDKKDGQKIFMQVKEIFEPERFGAANQEERLFDTCLQDIDGVEWFGSSSNFRKATEGEKVEYKLRKVFKGG